ncbi:chemotaxis protein CheA [Palleronia sp. KMU-117]|uniref:chemotaxis protein CheA n=1 Tax=Palleronia sp. KMU-117 TaxID=3434108 RepID=UPI003D757E67
MTDPMQEIRASFFVECEELLEALQDGLDAIEAGARDADTVNTVFRAVHSIKGGAGAFGLEDLVRFAHGFETALDALRAGRLDPGPGAIRAFFAGGDALADLVRAARDGLPADAAATAPVAEALGALVGDDAAADDDDGTAPAFTPMAIDLEFDLGLAPGPDGARDGAAAHNADRAAPAAEREVSIRFRPNPALYATGNEPAFLLRALADLGRLEARCTHAALPDLAAYDPASALIGWDVVLTTGVKAAAIREVFEFVVGLCDLEAPGIWDDRNSESDPTGAVLDDGPVVAPAPIPDSSTAPSAIFTPDLPAAAAPAATLPGTPPASPAGAGGAAGDASAGRADAAPGAAAGAAGPTVRVDLDRIDRLVNLVGELVINQAMLSQAVAGAGLAADVRVAAGLDEFLQLTRDIQDSVMMIRAQPVKPLFQRMARIVREASADVGKSVRLRTEGEATEIDKTVIERLADPLTHMVRNAVDHGLEPPADRIAAGKPPEGRITLSAIHRSGRVVIEVADDGRGIDRPKVQSIAEAKGLIPPGQTLSDPDIDALLFLPGFSTASAVSNLSGRGVGMDVVRSAITTLGGRIAIASDPGRGTRFTISLPLTLAVLDGMVVRVAGQTLVMPLNAITETLSVSPADVRLVGPDEPVIAVRGQVVPLLDLGVALGYRAAGEILAGAIVLLLGQEDGTRAALVVDGIEDQRQVVIKGLQDSYGRVPGVSAATILGDGKIALILDPADLVATAAGRGPQTPALRRSA